MPDTSDTSIVTSSERARTRAETHKLNPQYMMSTTERLQSRSNPDHQIIQKTESYSASTPKKPHIMTITSGKGGVGKTSLSVNLAIILARRGAKVCLLDADTGLANVNILLDISPRYTLEHLFTGQKNIHEIVVKAPGGIDIIPGASGFSKCVELNESQQQRLVNGLKSLEPLYDYILIDTSAGISPTVLHFVAAAQVAAVVVTPEPTSLTDAFSLLKVLYKRGYKREVQIMVNMCKSASEADRVFRRLNAAMQKYLKVKGHFAGAVWMDESVRSAVALQRPVALLPEADPSCRNFFQLADHVTRLFLRPEIPTLPFSFYWQRILARQQAKKNTTEKATIQDQNGPTEITSLPKKAESSPVSEESDKTVIVTPGKANEQEQVNSPLPWTQLRNQLSEFLESKNTEVEQRITLLTSAIYASEGKLGDQAGDLLMALLEVVEPEKIGMEQRKALHKILPISKSDSTQYATRLKVSQHENRESPQSPDQQYDERFGSQTELAARIRKSKGRMSLDQLLNSLSAPSTDY
jgi:MinD-like ATPase involved in chromosome partitioning or flagellar assembly